MVHASIIEARLSKLGVNLSRWFKPEIKELERILMDNEEIISVVPGRYFGGYAILIATDRRLLLIDKKAFFMNLEDIRYDTISEVDFSSRLIDSTVTIFTLNKQHRFSSSKYKRHLRLLTSHVQQQVMALRQQYQSAPAQDPQPQHHFTDWAHHLRRPQFLRTDSTHRMVGATAMLAHHRANSVGGFPTSSFTVHSQAGLSSSVLAD